MPPSVPPTSLLTSQPRCGAPARSSTNRREPVLGAASPPPPLPLLLRPPPAFFLCIHTRAKSAALIRTSVCLFLIPKLHFILWPQMGCAALLVKKNTFKFGEKLILFCHLLIRPVSCCKRTCWIDAFSSFHLHCNISLCGCTKLLWFSFFFIVLNEV